MSFYPFFACLMPEFGSKSKIKDLHIILFGSSKYLEIRCRKWRALVMGVNKITFTFVSIPYEMLREGRSF